ncbi:MAG: hypothetical protein DMF86_17470 [Acidobacteria bacterium]|nr:MAG: hypothetical protein DMF86_17470 [Acidobacteriota bacterium]
MQAALESLLRARKLDVTLTSAAGRTDAPPARFAPRRGHLSEAIGAPSTGRTTVVLQAIAAATARGELAALVDACDALDPASAAAAGVDLARLLWVRETGDAARALKAFSLILQAGGFGLVALDLADVAPATVRRFPWTTWMRVARIVEGSDTVALLVAGERVARSPAGVTIALESPAGARWSGTGPRARVFRGLATSPRIVRAH